MKKLVLSSLLVACLTLQPYATIQAQIDFSEMDILDFTMAFIAGVGALEAKKPLVDCKPGENIVQPLNCGDGFGGYKNNYYVFFISKDLEPESLYLSIGSQDLTLLPSRCKADSIDITIISKDDNSIPDSLKEENLTIPSGKKAIYFVVRVNNGDGLLNVKLLPRCR